MDLSEHCEEVAEKLLEGRLVPFLGAGVNLCDRPQGFQWGPDQREQLPSGSELADHLAKRFHYSRADRDLSRVAQFVDLIKGTGRLYEEVGKVFAEGYPVTSLHRFLASIPYRGPEYPLLVTTNYDNLLESAFLEQGREFDLVYYSPDDQPRGRFWLQQPGKPAGRIEDANGYGYEFFKQRPVILKIHGTAGMEESSGFVITEDHYIEFLADEALERLLPPSLLTGLRKNHLLFLGYSLRDWNLRVFLRRLKRKARERYASWAVVASCDPEEEKFWILHGVDIVRVDLKEYIPMLRLKLEAASHA